MILKTNFKTHGKLKIHMKETTKTSIKNNILQLLLVIIICILASIQSTKNELITLSKATETAWSNLETDLLNEFGIASQLNPNYTQLKQQFQTSGSLQEKIAVASKLQKEYPKLLEGKYTPQTTTIRQAFLKKAQLDSAEYNESVRLFNQTSAKKRYAWMARKLQFSPKPLFD